jgi:hypothetical protein
MLAAYVFCAFVAWGMFAVGICCAGVFFGLGSFVCLWLAIVLVGHG